jgi:transcription elongation factor GreB
VHRRVAEAYVAVNFGYPTLDGGHAFPIQRESVDPLRGEPLTFRGDGIERVVDKAYISREGHARLLAELDTLRRVTRPKIVDEVSTAAAMGDRSENAEYIYGKKKLREIDRRTRWIEKRLERLEVTDAEAPRGDRIFFGAWVTVESDNEDGARISRVLRVMGEDEVDLALGYISYRSPLGRALLKREMGDTVVVLTPRGEMEYDVTDVQYGASPP